MTQTKINMQKLLYYFTSALFLVVTLCSCTNNQEPDVYDIDTYKISFTGDVESFHASYGIYYYCSDSYLYDSNQHVVKVFTSETLPDSVSYSFKYKLDNRPKYIVFSCTALCFTDDGTKHIEGSIIREHDGKIVDKAFFEIKSFATTEKPNYEDYSFKINI
jgi:hypothetical protein